MRDECFSLEQTLGFSDINRREQLKENTQIWEGRPADPEMLTVSKFNFSLGHANPQHFFFTQKTELALVEFGGTLVLLCSRLCLQEKVAPSLQSCYNI